MTGAPADAACGGELAGVRVAVTRARAQAPALARILEARGAEVVEAAVIRIVPIPGPAPDLTRYDLICITSVNGVDAVFSRLADAGRDHRAFAGRRVAAVGAGTAAALAGRGVDVDIVPERSVAEGLLEALAEIEISRALILRAVVARDVLPDGLRARGVEVDVMAVYETVPESLDAEQLASVAAADYVTFTSSSTVRHLLSAAGGRISAAPRLVSIGPATSATMRECGLRVDLEAGRHDIDGLVDAIVADAAHRAGR